MAIDLADTTQELIPLTEPRRFPGKLTERMLKNWAENGLKAANGKLVFLETVKLGKTRHTTLTALQTFCDEMDGLTDPEEPAGE